MCERVAGRPRIHDAVHCQTLNLGVFVCNVRQKAEIVKRNVELRHVSALGIVELEELREGHSRMISSTRNKKLNNARARGERKG